MAYEELNFDLTPPGPEPVVPNLPLSLSQVEELALAVHGFAELAVDGWACKTLTHLSEVARDVGEMRRTCGMSTFVPLPELFAGAEELLGVTPGGVLHDDPRLLKKATAGAAVAKRAFIRAYTVNN